MTETDPKVTTDQPAPRRRRRVKRKAGLGAAGNPAQPATNPQVLAHSPGATPHRRRVRRRVKPLFHLSRRHQQVLSALVLAAAAAAIVAWFFGSSIENPQAYVPGGSIP